MARRRFKETRTKVAIQHAGTNISNTGSGSVPLETSILLTETGARTVDGSAQQTKGNATTDETCNIGDIVKYVNLFIQTGPRASQPNLDKTGWLEWAFLCVKESDTAVPNTQIGTQTLGNICTNMYRNECIWTGCLPCGQEQPNKIDIQIKIPKFKQHLRIGDDWRFVTYFRSTDSTSTSTAATRLVKSYMYKSYS